MASSEAHPTYRVLARTYRPARLSELIGQEALARTLANAFASGRIAHAFLLSGIRGVGKTTTARIIARGLNCTGADGRGGPTPEPCGACPSCVAIAEDRSLDVVEMDAASQTGKADVLELIEGVQFAPTSSRYKVFILDEVHMLSEKAWNALLKTVEEPPPHVKFVFATTEVRKVPVTVLSRCQRFELRRVETGTLVRHLTAICAREGIAAEDEALALIAGAAEGSVRDALSLLDQAIALSAGRVETARVQDMLGLGDRRRIVDLFDAMMRGAAPEVLERFADLYALGADPAAVLQDLLAFSHVLSRLKVGAPGGDGAFPMGPDLERRAREMAAGLSLGVLSRAWQMLLKGLEEVRSAPSASSAGEMVLLRVTCASELPPPGELARLLREGDRAPRPGPGQEPAASLPLEGPVRARGVALAERARDLDASVPAPAPRDEEPRSFAELVERLRGAGEAGLATWLFEGARLIRFEPGRIEFRPGPGMPSDVASRLAEAASRLTGRRWMVAVGAAEGQPTLAEVARAAKAARIEALARDARIRRVLDAFPGARIVDIREARPDGRANPNAGEKDA